MNDQHLLGPIHKVESRTDWKKHQRGLAQVNERNASFWNRQQEVYETMRDAEPEVQYQVAARLVAESSATNVHAAAVPVPAPQAAKRAPGRPSRKINEGRRQAISEIGPEVKLIDYCRELDRRGLKTPDDWQGCPKKYVDAYHIKRWNAKIRHERSRMKQRSSSSRCVQ